MKTVITLVVEHYKPITDLAEKAAQRTYTLDGVNNAQVVLSFTVAEPVTESVREVRA